MIEFASSILRAKGLPKMFCAEAIDIAFYILNRCPTRGIHNATPKEAFMGIKSSVAHRIFGCTMYAHVSKEERKTLDARAIKYFFMDIEMSKKLIKAI